MFLFNFEFKCTENSDRRVNLSFRLISVFTEIWQKAHRLLATLFQRVLIASYMFVLVTRIVFNQPTIQSVYTLFTYALIHVWLCERQFEWLAMNWIIIRPKNVCKNLCCFYLKIKPRSVWKLNNTVDLMLLVPVDAHALASTRLLIKWKWWNTIKTLEFFFLFFLFFTFCLEKNWKNPCFTC